MEEQKVNFQVAKLAKEKGFNIPTISYYTPEGYCTESAGYQTERLEESNWNNGQGSYPTSSEEVDCSAPTQALLQKWLREVHNIYVNSDYYQGYPEVRFYYDIKILIDDNYNGNQDSDDAIYTYEQAIELGLQEGLKLISNEL
jgi:hypothetical protein